MCWRILRARGGDLPSEPLLEPSYRNSRRIVGPRSHIILRRQKAYWWTGTARALGIYPTVFPCMTLQTGYSSYRFLSKGLFVFIYEYNGGEFFFLFAFGFWLQPSVFFFTCLETLPSAPAMQTCNRLFIGPALSIVLVCTYASNFFNVLFKC